jgi:ParB family chromosome partitioning protein
MAQSRGLGRGLSALIPSSTSRVVDEKIDIRMVEIPLSKLTPNKNQPRQKFADDSLGELAESIKEFGLIQPIVVRSIDRGESFEIISGERRFRAAQMIDMEKIPCIITHDIDDLSALEMALIENIQRDDLTPIELSHTFKQLIEEFNLTHEQLSKRIGKSRVAITNYMRLLLLPLEVQRMVDEGELSAGHARALLGLEDKASQTEVAGLVVKKDLNVRETERLVNRKNKEKSIDAKEKTVRVLRLNKLPQVEKKVADFLEAPVNIRIGKNKGRIEIVFGSVKDFERIVQKIIGNR